MAEEEAKRQREIARLRKQRGQVKKSMTLMETWLNEHGADATAAEVDTQLDRLAKHESRFGELQALLEEKDDTELASDEEQEGEDPPPPDERLLFEQRLSALMASLKHLKNTHDQSVLNDTAVNNMNNMSLDLSYVELPKDNLPTFNGDYLEYPMFMETFRNLIHENKSRGMTDFRRFNVLKSCCTGPAFDCISGYPPVDGSYALALEALDKRFLKKRLIFTSFIDKLWDIPKATNTQSLRKLADSYVAISKGLGLIANQQQMAEGIVIHLMSTKCDPKTLAEWEKANAGKEDLPSEENFVKFLNDRCTHLEGVEYVTKPRLSMAQSPKTVVSKFNKRTTNVTSRNAQPSTSKVVSDSTYSGECCRVCKDNHDIQNCPEFLNETPRGRYTTAKRVHYCVRCLKDTRSHATCYATCAKCKSHHHVLLHFDLPTPSNNVHTTNVTHIVNEAQRSVRKGGLKSPRTVSHDTYTFLATAIVHARTVDGNFVPLRVMFDSGSQLNLISDRARQLLGLPTTNTLQPIQLSGINNSVVNLRKQIVVTLKSVCSSYEDAVLLVVHPKLHQTHPNQFVDTSGWNIPTNINLADTTFNKPQPVDIILNAGQVDLCILPKSISLGKHLPRLRQTRFGYVVIGDCLTSHPPIFRTNTSVETHNDNISQLLQKFWEVESVNMKPNKILSSDDIAMEEHFARTTTRTTDGRFIVRLPFKRSPELLDVSRNMVQRRLYNINRKISSDEDYGKSYIEFIDEYVTLNHCTEVTKPISVGPHYYIPHFAVTNENSTTTRTRVVFDASCPTANGISLNELLHVGPRLQDDLAVHLLRFRLYKFAITADISKMYRQILVHPDDRKYQYILWKRPGENITRTFELNTVTYGTASAPYQAVKCIQELARQDGDKFPLAQKILLNNFYVDDMLAGTDDEKELLEIYSQIKELLNRAQMTIKKFQTNCQHTRTQIPEDDQGNFLHIGSKDVIKTLGLIWEPFDDCFYFDYTPSDDSKITRRKVLSELSRLFDPLGLIQPVIVRAKVFMQYLFTMTNDWDDPLSEIELNMWNEYRVQLQTVNQICVPRQIIDQEIFTKDKLVFEIHGFSDASEQAYAATIYIRSITPDGKSDCSLFTAKTRVAPLKTVTLPRLELLGAELLSELYSAVAPYINFPIARSVLWTDSTITLRWVTESPHKWDKYVGARSTKIQTMTAGCQWRHIPTDLNPADLATRGMSPKELSSSILWFKGPEFLRRTLEEQWPKTPNLPDDVPETAKVVKTLTATIQDDFLSRCRIMSFVPLIQAAVWPVLRRIFGYVHRYLTNLRKKFLARKELLVSNEDGLLMAADDVKNSVVTYDDVPLLTVSELEAGTKMIIKAVQKITLAEQLNTLEKKRSFPTKSKFAKLSVFLDDENLMRVGGRLRHSPEIIDYNERFPLVIPYDHVVTRLIFMWDHIENLHAGPSALLALVREKYWPLKGKVSANRCVNNCITCCRAKPVTYEQIMGDLPRDRVTFTRAFEVSAVDFAGPFMVHYRMRGSRMTKAYLAIFICMATKAVHLELVEDLTTEAFLNCLQRFTCRRNTPRKIWSDNATNFVGASRKLEEFKKFYFDDKTQKDIQNWCRDHKSISWNFIPPRSPHFNGLVEAAVKSAKYHLVRIINGVSLTFPELNTIMIMIEGILNSRPLIPLSCDPSDQIITPAHFLLGVPLEALPEPIVDDAPVKRYDKALAVKQAFWRKWSKEYLKTLQEKHQWTKEHPGPQIDDLVVLVDENVAPFNWTLGKITHLVHGQDDIVRVVDVETNTSGFRRAITQLCPVIRQKSH